VAAAVLVPLLLALAAAGPAVRKHVGRRVRTDAQAIFVFDTSRSMAASAGDASPTRFSQARAAAIALRAAVPEVPAGVASFTTQLVPHLFPTRDDAAFNSTVEEAIGIEKPPPPFFQFGIPGTSFGPLAQLRNQGFFDPKTKHRFAVVLTDAESGPFDPSALRTALVDPNTRPTFPGRPIYTTEPPVSLFVVRVGDPTDRIYRSSNDIESAYRADPRAAENADSLAAVTRGRAYTTADLHEDAAALQKLVGSGGSSFEGTRTKTETLAPYVVLLAFFPLGVVLWRRNLKAL
jgi:uncharacterized protein (DUF58 family)